MFCVLFFCNFVVIKKLTTGFTGGLTNGLSSIVCLVVGIDRK